MSNSPIPESDRAAQRSRLLGLKLRALVADHLSRDGDRSRDGAAGEPAEFEPAEFGPGAALRAGDVAWILLDDSAGPRLGAALAWALRNDATALSVIAPTGDPADPVAPIIARRAQEFSFAISVYADRDRLLEPVSAAGAHSAVDVPDHHREFTELIIEGGAEPTVEFGVLAGEVRGLEVCRVVDDPAMQTTRLEVGTGAHDREAFAMLHGDTPTAESLKRIADTVAQHRADGAPPHPLNRLAQERLLRHRAMTGPELLGGADGASTELATLRPAEPPVPRTNLKDAVPAVATGEDVDGNPVVVVFAVGIDLELVPFAADARRALDPSAELVICTPARDQIPLLRDLNARLARPARLTTL